MSLRNDHWDRVLLLSSGSSLILSCNPDCELRFFGVISFQFQYTPVRPYITRHTGEMYPKQFTGFNLLYPIDYLICKSELAFLERKMLCSIAPDRNRRHDLTIRRSPEMHVPRCHIDGYVYKGLNAHDLKSSALFIGVNPGPLEDIPLVSLGFYP